MPTRSGSSDEETAAALAEGETDRLADSVNEGLIEDEITALADDETTATLPEDAATFGDELADAAARDGKPEFPGKLCIESALPMTPVTVRSIARARLSRRGTLPVSVIL